MGRLWRCLEKELGSSYLGPAFLPQRFTLFLSLTSVFLLCTSRGHSVSREGYHSLPKWCRFFFLSEVGSKKTLSWILQFQVDPGCGLNDLMRTFLRQS